MILINLFSAIFLAHATSALICESNQAATFIHTQDFSFPSAIATAADQTLVSCIQMCAINNIPGGSVCRGFNFYIDGTCEFFNTVQKAASQLSPSPGVETYEKVCMPPDIITCASGFDRQPQKILSGFARDVLPDVSKQDCLYGCLDAEFIFGYKCLSVMYYYDTRECILNSENSMNFPHLQQSTTEDVDYLDHRCDGQYSEWSQWSLCEDNSQQRSRQCNPPATCLGRDLEEQSCGLTTTTTVSQVSTTSATMSTPSVILTTTAPDGQTATAQSPTTTLPKISTTPLGPTATTQRGTTPTETTSPVPTRTTRRVSTTAPGSATTTMGATTPTMATPPAPTTSSRSLTTTAPARSTTASVLTTTGSSGITTTPSLSTIEQVTTTPRMITTITSMTRTPSTFAGTTPGITAEYTTTRCRGRFCRNKGKRSKNTDGGTSQAKSKSSNSGTSESKSKSSDASSQSNSKSKGKKKNENRRFGYGYRFGHNKCVELQGLDYLECIRSRSSSH